MKLYLRSCQRGATYIVESSKNDRGKDHAFACERHLGEIVSGAVEGSEGGKARVRYCPAPGDQPCEWGVE